MNRVSTDSEVSVVDLVRRAQSGDSAAFAGLVSRYQDRVYNTCYRMCNNEADALDLTQSTFLKALEALPRFEARSKFYTWLFRIAVNMTISHRRAARRRPTASLDQTDPDGHEWEPADTDCPNGAERAEQQEMRGRLETALTRLDEEFRVAVVLKDIEDMDYATIAEVLDLPLGTVKSRIHRGRMMLRALLTGERD